MYPDHESPNGIPKSATPLLSGPRRRSFVSGSAGATAALLLALALLFLFNLRFLSRFFDWDSVIYALNIQRDMIWPVFLNPHHLGFESSGYLYIKIIEKLFGPQDLMFVLRLRILGSALLFLFAFVMIHRSLYGSSTTAFLLALAVAFSQGFWFYSHHNDTPLLPACFIALVFLLCAHQVRNGFTRKGLALVGLVQVMSVYFHQTNALFLPLVPAALLMSPTWRGRDWAPSARMRLIALYLAAVAAVLTASYLYVGVVILNRNVTAAADNDRLFGRWLLLYATRPRWGFAPVNKSYVIDFYRGIGDAFLNFRGTNAPLRVDFSRPFDAKNAPYNINAIFWLTVFGLALLNLRGLVRKYGREVVLLLLWIGPSVLFYSWWEGYFFEFWVGTSIALWLFSFYALDSLPTGPFARARKALMHTAYLLMIFVLFTVNFTFSTLPRSRRVLYSEIINEPLYEQRVRALAREKVYR